MTERTRQDELSDVPLWKANKQTWPRGVRPIGQGELDCLGIDRRGDLYWDGKPIEVAVYNRRRTWLLHSGPRVVPRLGVRHRIADARLLELLSRLHRSDALHGRTIHAVRR